MSSPSPSQTQTDSGATDSTVGVEGGEAAAGGASHANNNNNNNASSQDAGKGPQNTTANNNTTSTAETTADRLSPEQDIFINPADGLPIQHPVAVDADSNSDRGDDAGEVDPDSFDDLPTSIIVTNIHSEVFASPQLKQQMEELFRSFCASATFQWLRSFRRLRVNYDNAVAAANARIKLHQYEFNQKTVITCYFAQPVTPVSNKNLQPPAPVKQFLISPPASPPAGWEPREENEPLVNHDLLAALASLTPGESHELHPQSEDQPAIIVHTAVVPEAPATGNAANNGLPRQPIVPTKCPERA